jgi:hypothetical protein
MHQYPSVVSPSLLWWTSTLSLSWDTAPKYARLAEMQKTVPNQVFLKTNSSQQTVTAQSQYCEYLDFTHPYTTLQPVENKKGLTRLKPILECIRSYCRKTIKKTMRILWYNNTRPIKAPIQPNKRNGPSSSQTPSLHYSNANISLQNSCPTLRGLLICRLMSIKMHSFTGLKQHSRSAHVTLSRIAKHGAAAMEHRLTYSQSNIS